MMEKRSDSERHFNILIKPVSGDCNLKCTYCFYRRPIDPYRSKELHRMSDVVLRNLIAQQMSSSGDYVSFGWQGGEPLLAGVEFFYKVVNYQKLFGYPGQMVANTVQTNGTLINEEWAYLFSSYNFLVGVSIDGPKFLHDKYRITPANDGTFDRVMQGIDLLRRYEVPFDILMVLNDHNVKMPKEIYAFLIDNKFRYVHFIPCLISDPETGEITDFSITPDEYGDFLTEIFNLWYDNGRPLKVRFFENIVAVLFGLEPDLCFLNKECASYLVVEYNGDVYPCDFFVEEKWKLGNIMNETIDEIIKSERLKRFASLKYKLDDECKTCKWLTFCYGGCPKMRLKNTNKFYFCRSHKKFLGNIADRLHELRELYVDDDL